MAATHMWEVKDVLDASCEYMGCNMDVKNCVRMYCIADFYSCETWKKPCLDYILENFSIVYQQVRH